MSISYFTTHLKHPVSNGSLWETAGQVYEYDSHSLTSISCLFIAFYFTMVIKCFSSAWLFMKMINNESRYEFCFGDIVCMVAINQQEQKHQLRVHIHMIPRRKSKFSDILAYP